MSEMGAHAAIMAETEVWHGIKSCADCRAQAKQAGESLSWWRGMFWCHNCDGVAS